MVSVWINNASMRLCTIYDLGYDPADQLVAAIFKSVTPPAILKRYHYAYDAAGNRTAEQIDDLVNGARFDTMNRLTSRYPGGTLHLQGTVSESATVTIAGQPATVTTSNVFSGPGDGPSGQHGGGEGHRFERKRPDQCV